VKIQKHTHGDGSVSWTTVVALPRSCVEALHAHRVRQLETRLLLVRILGGWLRAIGNADGAIRRRSDLDPDPW
jgi:hypothetical protein